MKAFQITNIKEFMNLLLQTECFASFYLQEATLQTLYTLELNGLRNVGYDPSYQENSVSQNLNDDPVYSTSTKTNYVTWKEIRPDFLSLLRGKKLPVLLKLTFKACASDTEKIFSDPLCTVPVSDINDFIFNIKFENNRLILITGTNYARFIPDKSAELLWDRNFAQFLNQEKIEFSFP